VINNSHNLQSRSSTLTTMAEAVLYGNRDQPELPYEELAPYLTWVPDYISSRTRRRAYDELESFIYSLLVDILLVFSRSRTSALHDGQYRPVLEEFIENLNAIQHKIPGNTVPELQSIQTDRGIFIFCKDSKRFNRYYSPTHR
jgi:hypothetical protein